MISYQWDSQAVMMKVKDRLRQAGYKVWMDIEHMSELFYVPYMYGNILSTWVYIV
jgi:hypothetical protein